MAAVSYTTSRDTTELGVQVEIRTLRILRMNEYKLLFGHSIRHVGWLRFLETKFPRLFLVLAESAVVLVTKVDPRTAASPCGRVQATS